MTLYEDVIGTWELGVLLIKLCIAFVGGRRRPQAQLRDNAEQEMRRMGVPFQYCIAMRIRSESQRVSLKRYFFRIKNVN